MSSRWRFVRPRYLFSDLERRSTREDALVVLAAEFGRTPVINANGGRDHHPQAYSCMLAGGGINGGQVWGKTDERGSKTFEGKVRVEAFNATIGYALGPPLDQVLYSPSARPFTMADKGKSLVEIFG